LRDEAGPVNDDMDATAIGGRRPGTVEEVPGKIEGRKNKERDEESIGGEDTQIQSEKKFTHRGPIHNRQTEGDLEPKRTVRICPKRGTKKSQCLMISL